VAWPGTARRALALTNGGAPVVAGTLWTAAAPAPSTVLLLDGRHATVEAVRVTPGGHVERLPPVRVAGPAGASWRAVTGDAGSGRLYLLDARSRVYTLPLPAAWQAPPR
jgi:hypothetical protein